MGKKTLYLVFILEPNFCFAITDLRSRLALYFVLCNATLDKSFASQHGFNSVNLNTSYVYTSKITHSCTKSHNLYCLIDNCRLTLKVDNFKENKNITTHIFKIMFFISPGSQFDKLASSVTCQPCYIT